MKDLHVHSIYSDGKSTPREIIESAIAIGLDTIGFSDHSYFEVAGYSIKKDKIEVYQNEIRTLADEYKDKITVLCGIEQDYFSKTDTAPYDYVIGSIHYIDVNGEFCEVDHTAEDIKRASDKHFGGDAVCYAERYFEMMCNLVEKTNCTIIGHFDLVTKFNENGEVFDMNDPRYISAWKKASDKLLKYGIPFEINTGAISRKKRTTPYPTEPIMSYLKDNGAKFILSSDSHQKETLAFEFKKYEHLLH